jgi:hypothetical protein
MPQLGGGTFVVGSGVHEPPVAVDAAAVMAVVVTAEPRQVERMSMFSHWPTLRMMLLQ